MSNLNKSDKATVEKIMKVVQGVLNHNGYNITINKLKNVYNSLPAKQQIAACRAIVTAVSFVDKPSATKVKTMYGLLPQPLQVVLCNYFVTEVKKQIKASKTNKKVNQ